MSEVKIEGLKEFGKLCRELPVAVGKKVLAHAVAAPTRLIRDDAIRRAPVDTGRLQQAILMKKIPSDRPDVITTYIVTVRHGKKAQTTKKWGGTADLDAYYWTFLEFGTAKMSAKPFIRPAFESNKNEALTMMINGIAAGVEREATDLSWGKV